MTSLPFFFQPYLNHILVQPDKMEEVTAGGIVLPQNITASMKSFEGVVLAVGNGFYNEHNDVMVNLEIFPGDKVMFDDRLAHKFKRGDEEYVVLPHKAVLGITNASGRDAYQAAQKKTTEPAPPIPGGRKY